MVSTHIQAVILWLEAQRDEAEANAAKTAEREQWLRRNGWVTAAEKLHPETLRWTARAEAFAIVAPKAAPQARVPQVKN